MCPSFSPIAVVTLVVKQEERNTNSSFICGTLSVHPRPVITQNVDNTPISAGTLEEIESFDPFYNGRVNITGSNLSYECAVENSVLKQTWTGRWTMKDRFPGAVCVYVLGQRQGGNGLIYRERRGEKRQKMHPWLLESRDWSPRRNIYWLYYLKPSFLLLTIRSSLMKRK